MGTLREPLAHLTADPSRIQLDGSAIRHHPSEIDGLHARAGSAVGTKRASELPVANASTAQCGVADGVIP
jgi:hypothetical protein